MKEAVMLMLLAATMAAFVGKTTAASFIVGDKTGWTIPSSSSFYSNWAAKQTFQRGDVLVFNFSTGAHTVAEVSKAAYDSCSTTNLLSAVKTTAPANYTLSSAGTHYYICTITGHCSIGQKLAVTATGPSSSAPAPQPSKKSPTPSPAPSPSKKTPSPAPTPSTTPSSSPAPSPSSTPPVAPSPSGNTPTVPPSASPPSGGGGGGAGAPSAGSTPTAAGGPTTPPPSSDNSAAPSAAGVSLLSLMSMTAVALLF